MYADLNLWQSLLSLSDCRAVLSKLCMDSDLQACIRNQLCSYHRYFPGYALCGREGVLQKITTDTAAATGVMDFDIRNYQCLLPSVHCRAP